MSRIGNLPIRDIIKVYETFQSKHNNKNIMIVMELCTGGDLRVRYPYTEQQVAIVLKHLLNAVSYLHTRGIVHRDIKLEVRSGFQAEKSSRLVIKQKKKRDTKSKGLLLHLFFSMNFFSVVLAHFPPLSFLSSEHYV